MQKRQWILAALGTAVGAVNGFMGGGGGVFAIVALTAVAGLQQKNAQATAILIILPTSLVSAVIYIFSGSVDWTVTLYSTIGITLGGVLGALLLKKLNNDTLKLIFGFVLILAGVRMVV